MSARPCALALTVLGIFGRLSPHPENFTPIGAAALFAGARLRGWQAWIVPLAAMTISNPLVGVIYGRQPFSRLTPAIYASLLVYVWLGRLLRATESPLRLGAAAFAGSLQFFLVTNFFVWLGSRFYAQTWAGLAACYTAALPFFGRSLAGDLVFTAVLFGLHAWASRAVFHAERVTVAPAL